MVTVELESTHGRPEVYLVLAIHKTGNIDVCAIATSQRKANIYRKAVQDMIDYDKAMGKHLIRVWVERREMDHLYAVSMLDPDILQLTLTKVEYELVYDSLGRGNKLPWRMLEAARKQRAEEG